MRILLLSSFLFFYAISQAARASCEEKAEGISSLSLAPEAMFICYYTGICLGNETNFLDQSTGNIVSWKWEFPGGTPSTSTEQNPWVDYQQEGVFDVSLTVTDINGDTSKLTMPDMITVVGAPQPSFDYTQSGRTVDFMNTTDSIPWGLYYNWYFGDGNTSSLESPTHTYAQDGMYTVRLQARGECGWDVFELDILIDTPPQSSFTATPNEGCEPMQVYYDASSSIHADSYYWEFEGGDPAVSTELQPSVTYYSPGSYDVRLITYNQYLSDTLDLTDHIQVGATPTSDFTYIVDELTVEFTNLSIGYNIVQYRFGDGNSTEVENPIHTYATDGIYTVQLISINDCGRDTMEVDIEISALPKAEFEASDTSLCEKNTIQFDAGNSSSNATEVQWEFEGGTPSTSTKFSETVMYDSAGLFDVTLVASNHLGSDTLVLENYIEVKNLPLGEIGYLTVEDTVHFQSTAMHYDSIHWLFGDGNESSELNPVHIYNEEGAFNVQLKIFAECDTLHLNQMVEIYLAPVANFHLDTNASCPPFTVHFQNTSTLNADTFSWRFEGGAPSQSFDRHPIVTYTAPGTYDVELIAISNGGRDTISVKDAIKVFELPEANFNYTLNSTSAYFENLSTSADSFLWLFGDGNSSLEINPVHTYSYPGEYEVLLIAVNTCEQDTFAQIIKITTTNALEGIVESVLLYPNPVVDNITIENIPSGAIMYITDPTGRRVWQLDNALIDRLNIQTQHWPGGIYYLQIMCQGKNKTIRWILQR